MRISLVALTYMVNMCSLTTAARGSEDNNKNNKQLRQRNLGIDKSLNKFNVESVHPTQRDEGDKNIFDGGDGEVEPEIVGGIEVNPRRKYNFFVTIGGCGASLVAPNVLLSAAHCSGITGPATIGVHMKTVDSAAEFDEVARIPFETSIVHPDYNSNTLDNDYWVIKLEHDVPEKFQDAIVPLNSDPSFPAAGQDITVIGLGTTSSGGSTPNAMREVTVDYITNTACCSSPYEYACNEITDNMLCAARSGKDSCQGDSGGPIFAVDGNNFTQVGIVSWGYGCADSRYPGVYSRVSAKYTWIQDQINAYNSNGNNPAPTPSGLVDDPYFWYDNDGPTYSCEWYASGNNCRRYGDSFPNGGISANMACAACGGGKEIPVTPAPTTLENGTPQPSPTPPACKSGGDACNAGGECCSGNCKRGTCKGNGR